MTEPCIHLKALTPEAKIAFGGSYLTISRFPFRVGRESRGRSLTDAFQDSRRRADSTPNNDLYLVEMGTELNISREHFLIDRKDDRFIILDRGSACGTLVEGEPVGAKRTTASRALEENDVIIVGTSESRYVFKFMTTIPER